MTRNLTFIFTLVLITLVSCNKLTKAQLVGKWKITGGTSMSYKTTFEKDYYQFKGDGTFVHFEDMSFASSADLIQTGTYQLRTDKDQQMLTLKFNSSGPPETWKIVKYTHTTLELVSYAGFTLLLKKE